VLTRFCLAQLNTIIWFFYVSKLAQFADTAILIFRKKQFPLGLHLYHHIGTVTIYWLYLVYRPSGDVYLAVVPDALITVILYVYTGLVVSYRFRRIIVPKFCVELLPLLQLVLNTLPGLTSLVLFCWDWTSLSLDLLLSLYSLTLIFYLYILQPLLSVSKRRKHQQFKRSASPSRQASIKSLLKPSLESNIQKIPPTSSQSASASGHFPSESTSPAASVNHRTPEHLRASQTNARTRS
jgi:hypothetical protein